MAKVLVIDDDEGVRRSLREILERAEHQVQEAINGRDGVAVLGRSQFDLVITDIMMPGHEGIELIVRIKELLPALPVIAISGAFTDDFSPLEDARLMGADRVLAKLFTVDQILGAINELVLEPS